MKGQYLVVRRGEILHQTKHIEGARAVLYQTIKSRVRRVLDDRDNREKTIDDLSQALTDVIFSLEMESLNQRERVLGAIATSFLCWFLSIDSPPAGIGSDLAAKFLDDLRKAVGFLENGDGPRD